MTPRTVFGLIVSAMTQTADRSVDLSPWSPREAELLAVTLQLLQEHGYDGLTVDAVASASACEPLWCASR